MDGPLVADVPPDVAVRARGFVGREWIVHAIDGWLTSGPERYLMIVGEPGWGKTALTAWLAGLGPLPPDPEAARRLAHLRQQWNAVHFCIGRGQLGTVDPVQFTEDLARRLAGDDEFAQAMVDELAPDLNVHVRQRVQQNWGTVIGTRIEQLVIAHRDPLAVYNQVIRQPLWRLARQRPDLRVLIAVDGLDEALTGQGPTIVSLLAGSMDLPPGVRFVLTSRDEPKVRDQFDGLRTLDLSAPQHAKSADADLRAYIEGRLMTEERLFDLASDDPDEFTARLLRRADGNFLYTSWVLDEAAAGIRTDFKALPNGLYGLYRRFLDRLVPDDLAWAKRHEPFFGCLAVATPVAPDASLPRWLGWGQGKFNRHVQEVTQAIEHVASPEESGYRLYHRSVADFLAAGQYEDHGRLRLNEYYVDPYQQHDRIASYYLDQVSGDWAGDWSRSDRYGLRQLVTHLRARLDLAEAEAGRQALVDQLYGVALHPRFQAAQRKALDSIYPTLTDLRTVLDVALARRSGADLIMVLRCAAAFRRTAAAESLSQAVFGAIADHDLALAVQNMSHYTTGSAASLAWQDVLRLYLAWEAAESGRPQPACELVRQSASSFSPAVSVLADAFLVRIALALGSADRDPAHWLAEFGRAPDALTLYPLAAELPPDLAAGIAETIRPSADALESLTEAGSPDAVSGKLFADEQPLGVMDPETTADVVSSLERDLRQIAANEEGKHLITRLLRPIIQNPYPRYRDISLAALGTSVLASPERSWVRRQMQLILRAGLDDEGITFSFDLATMVLAECDARHLPADGLRRYVRQAADRQDVWGTCARALSAQAAAAHRYGRAEEALALLLEASREPTTYAGYGAVAILALVDRCHEFGRRDLPGDPIWGPGRTESLYDQAMNLAGRVYDWQFRGERLELIQQHRTWAAEPAPEVGFVEQRLSSMPDIDARRAYLQHVSARWAASPDPQVARQVAALVPLSLFDTTVLDAILARLVAIDLPSLAERDLLVLTDLVEAHFTTGRPWQYGQWR
jgi:hypothetical protein